MSSPNASFVLLYLYFHFQKECTILKEEIADLQEQIQKSTEALGSLQTSTKDLFDILQCDSKPIQGLVGKNPNLKCPKTPPSNLFMRILKIFKKTNKHIYNIYIIHHIMLMNLLLLTQDQ